MWFGIGKLTEEIGELQQVIGKLIPFPTGDHPDGGPPLRLRLIDELADVRAALTYFAGQNLTKEECSYLMERCGRKVLLFERWGLSGIPSQPVEKEKST